MLAPLPLYSLKNRSRLRWAATSFVYPAGYAENVRTLGPFVDEIELLFLESKHPGDLPGPKLLQELLELKTEFNLTYNIHLPMDVIPNAVNSDLACSNTAILNKFICQTAYLQPESYCLHLPWDNDPHFELRCYETISKLLANVEPHKLTVENLDYPLTVLKDVIEELDVGVCFDIGHALAFDTGFAEHVRAFAKRIQTVHLHAPEGNKDAHNALDLLGDNWPQVLEFLRNFNGTVSLELFDIQRLNDSLKFLEPFLGELT